MFPTNPQWGKQITSLWWGQWGCPSKKLMRVWGTERKMWTKMHDSVMEMTCLLNNVHRIVWHGNEKCSSPSIYYEVTAEPRSTERVSSPNLPDIWDTQALTFMPVGGKKDRVRSWNFERQWKTWHIKLTPKKSSLYLKNNEMNDIHLIVFTL